MREEAASSTTYSIISDITGKHRKIYVDNPRDRSKLTSLIHGPGHSSYKCKVLGDFGTKYAKFRLTKDHRKDPATRKKFGINQENNAIVQHAVDEIILQEKKILSVKYETHENIDYEFNEDELYRFDKTSLDYKE